ncbi:MAG: HlyD family efflux transporter periplasmic adaptor subunit [Porphyromonas sp.]|nr:HlyD family efflux transporter periplasmic adaptor subunit [Porphyromonas sp.]
MNINRLPLITTLLVSLAVTITSCSNSGDDYDATGVFEAREVLVSAQANGEILALDLEEGSRLQAGQEVGLVDTTQLYLQKAALLANNRGIQVQRPDIDVQLSSLREQLNTLRTERERVAQLLAAEVATQKQLDDIDNQIRLVESQLQSHSSTLSKSTASITAQSSAVEIQVTQIEEQIRKSIITSPISGVVLQQYKRVGELATMGAPLFKVADIDLLDLRAYLTYDQVAQLKLGDTVEVRIDDGEGGKRSYEGSLQWISDKAEFTPKAVQTEDERANLVYATKIRVENDGYIKIGMYGEVVLHEE